MIGSTRDGRSLWQPSVLYGTRDWDRPWNNSSTVWVWTWFYTGAGYLPVKP